MSRRDTIIISVFVNAALLAALFITAVTTKTHVEEDAKIANATLLEETTIDAKELFSSNVETKDTSASQELVAPEAQKEFVSLLEEKDKVEIKEEKNIVYKLPQLAKKTEEKKTEPFQETIELIVKKGDSLEKIARVNNVKISEISKLNNLPNSFIRIGQKLIIPKTSRSNANVTKSTVAKPTNDSASQKIAAEYYTVRVGDNPYTIAIKHNVKPSQLLKLNNLDEKKARRLKPGDKLRIR